VDNDLEFSVAIQIKDCSEVVRVVWLVVALAATEASYLKDAPALYEALKTFTCFEPKTEKGSQQRQQVRPVRGCRLVSVSIESDDGVDQLDMP
jgi:hypothetical protein